MERPFLTHVQGIDLGPVCWDWLIENLPVV